MVDDLRSAPSLASPQASRIRRPRWRDARLLAGVLLVLVSVVLGARVLAAADDTVAVWSVTTDLAQGSALHAADIKIVQVRLGEVSAAYLGTNGPSPVGYLTTRAITADELLAVNAVVAPGTAPPTRNVTVAVERFHAPGDLARGQRVDVYVTPKDGVTRAVLAGALVSEVVADGGRLGPSGASLGVVLSVQPAQVAALVQAAQDGALDLVSVPAGS